MKLLLAIVYFSFSIAAFYAEESKRPVVTQSFDPFQGIWRDKSFFPIGVWVQNPKNAERYKAAGINLYVGLWQGPTVEQLDTLQKSGLHVICSQGSRGLALKDHPSIIAWMHGDEPDNAQPLRDRKGYGPPITPEVIQANYEKIRANDPGRPVFLNLGQGVAWDNYIGRGVRRNHPEDYPEYIKGCDIASFDIYPVVHDHKDIAGKLEMVACGVKRLRDWSGGSKPAWNCIECTHIANPEAKPSPTQIRAEVWMSLIHGSRGLIYFVHQFKPSFNEAALLDDPVNLAAVSEINRQITLLAPVLNSPSLPPVGVETKGEIATMLKKSSDALYLFTVNMRDEATEAGFKSREFTVGTFEEIGADRTILVKDSSFQESFGPYEVHLYKCPLGR